VKVKAMLCEKIPEKEFDKCPDLNPGWREDFRKDGFVYIIYDSSIFEPPPENSVRG